MICSQHFFVQVIDLFGELLQNSCLSNMSHDSNIIMR